VEHDEQPAHAHDRDFPTAGADHGKVAWVHGVRSGQDGLRNGCAHRCWCATGSQRTDKSRGGEPLP
jgi:hypothetical protein